MTQAPLIFLAVDTYAGMAFAIGVLIPIGVVSLGAGYILGCHVLEQLSRTILGTHVRHALARIAPSKRFDSSDRQLIEDTVILAIKAGRIST